MGEFKPMVKMETTEPSVELKLKKGGSAHKKMSAKGEAGHKAMPHKMDGGIMGALAGATPVIAGRTAAPVARGPARPSLAARRRAMVARPVKKGGACYKDGGSIINTEGQGGEYRDTKMHTSKTDKSPAKTGDVKMGNAGGYKTGGVAKANGGGYKTGGVALGNAGGFKKGGATKKFASGGAVQDDGRAQRMPQGEKKPSSPVSIDKLSGTFKKGGNVSTKKLQATFKKENAPAMKAAKKDTDEVYSKYQKGKKFAEGGSSYDESFQDPASQLREMKRMGRISDAEARMAADNARDKQYPVGKMLKGAVDKVKSLFDSSKGAGSVTDTEKTISRTVTPPAGKFKGAYAPSEELKKFDDNYKRGGKTRK